MSRTNVLKEFGAAVRAHRLRLGLSQETLAERAALHRTYVTDVERGARNLSLASISRLAGALDLSISSLFEPTALEIQAGRRGKTQSADILLVEDDPKDIELTLAAFKEAKLCNRVEVVHDGVQALEFLWSEGGYAHRKRGAPPLLVLLDLELPKLNGLEVLRKLRGDARTRDLQVVVLTSSRRAAYAQAALDLGAQAYVVKPLDFQAFSGIAPQLNFSWSLLRSGEPRTNQSQELGA